MARFEERRPRAGVQALIDELQAQEIPSQSRSEGVLAGGGAVRLLTAHRSKGLEWDLVVVASVQDGGWPDVRRRASLLDGDRLDRDELLPAPTAASLVVDERRLFYVAVTRARQRLLVTAVRSPLDDGERPSRFLSELGLPVPDKTERPGPAAVAGLVDRSTAPGAGRRGDRPSRCGSPLPHRWPDSPRSVRRAAVRAGGPSRPLVGDARAEPRARHRCAPSTQPVALSASAVAGFQECPLKWFLEREAKAVQASTASAGFGLVVHALASMVATGAVPAELSVLLDRLDQVWGSLGFDARWQREGERVQAGKALERFLNWHSLDRGREWVASEWEFSVPYEDTVLRRLLRPGRARRPGPHRGRRLQDLQDRARRRQGRRQPAARRLPDRGARRGSRGQGRGATRVGGAELVQLRSGQGVRSGGDGLPKIQPQARPRRRRQ